MKEYQVAHGPVIIEFQGKMPRALLSALIWSWNEFLACHPQLKKNLNFQNLPVRISLGLVTDRQMKPLNLRYRGKNYATDVLSFPSFENLRFQPRLAQGPILHLGDIIVATGVAKKQSKEFGVSYFQELIHLAHHGFLHLLGFDHERSTQEQVLMEEMEQVLLDLYTISRRM